MRRFLLSFVLAGSTALLAACGSGGSAFSNSSNNSVNHVIVTGASALQGVDKVAPGAAIVLSAEGTNGSQNIYVPGSGFAWSVAIAPVGTLVQANAGGAQVACNGFSLNPAYPASAIAIDANAPQITLTTLTAAQVIALAPGATAVAASGASTSPPTAPAGSYCLTVNATYTANGQVGSATVLVSNT